jgi:hypothetical protein
MIILDKIVQNSPEWFAEKLGKPSSSDFKKIHTSTGKRSSQRKAYMYKLAGERISGKREETYRSANMGMGNEREDQSRKIYEFYNDVEVEEIGLVYRNEDKKYLCSPDGIINREYGLEMKNVIQKTQIKRLIDGKLPTEYFPQVQGSLLITGYKRWDFLSYCPLMPELILTVKRDEKYIKQLEVALDIFVLELDSLVADIKEKYGIKKEK